MTKEQVVKMRDDYEELFLQPKCFGSLELKEIRQNILELNNIIRSLN